jgi:hypothetical protein
MLKLCLHVVSSSSSSSSSAAAASASTCTEVVLFPYSPETPPSLPPLGAFKTIEVPESSAPPPHTSLL